MHRDHDGRVLHIAVTLAGETVWLQGVDPDRLRSIAGWGPRPARLTVVVDDVDEHYQRAAAAGAVIISPPDDQSGPAPEFSTYDSGGRVRTFVAQG